MGGIEKQLCSKKHSERSVGTTSDSACGGGAHSSDHKLAWIIF